MGIKLKFILWLLVTLSVFTLIGQRVSSQLVFNQPYYIAGDTAYFTLRFAHSNEPSGVLRMGMMNESGQVLKQINFRVTGGIGANQFVIPQEIKTGHYPLLVYDASGQTVIQSYLNVGVHSHEPKSTSSFDVVVATDNEQLTRGKSTLSIKVTDKSGVPVQGNLTVSVLNSEVINAAPVEATSNAKAKLPFRMTLMGRLTNEYTREVLPDSSMVMLYFQNSRLRYLTYVREEGMIKAEILDYYDKDELFLIAETPEGQIVKDIQVEWEKATPATPESASRSSQLQVEMYERFMNKKQLMDKSYGYYGTRDSLNFTVQQGTRLDFLEADYKTNPRDYLLFKSLGEFIKTTVEPIYYGVIGDQEAIRVLYLKPYAATADPLYVIDGKVTLDTDYFLSLNQDDIIGLKVVSNYRKLVKFGLLGKNGIVIVNTRLNESQPPENSDMVFMGLNKPRIFSVNNYLDGEDSNIPNFRACVHWVSNVTLDSNGEAIITYYNSDDVGTMHVYVNGLTTEGQPFYGSTDYEVNISTENE